MNNVGWVLRFKPVCVWVMGGEKKKRAEAFDCIRLTVAPSEEIAGEMSLHFSTSLNPQWWTATPDPGSDRVSSNHTSVFSRNYGSFKPHGWTAGGEVTGLFEFFGLKIKIIKKKKIGNESFSNAVQRRVLMMRHFAGLARFWLNVQQSIYFMKKRLKAHGETSLWIPQWQFPVLFFLKLSSLPAGQSLLPAVLTDSSQS